MRNLGNPMTQEIIHLTSPFEGKSLGGASKIMSRATKRGGGNALTTKTSA